MSTREIVLGAPVRIAVGISGGQGIALCLEALA